MTIETKKEKNINKKYGFLRKLLAYTIPDSQKTDVHYNKHYYTEKMNKILDNKRNSKTESFLHSVILYNLNKRMILYKLMTFCYFTRMSIDNLFCSSSSIKSSHFCPSSPEIPDPTLTGD